MLRALAGRQGPERLLDLALRSGPYGDQFGRQFGGQPDGLALTKIQQAPGGIDLGPLQPRVPEVLRTPSGKIELAPRAGLADGARARLFNDHGSAEVTLEFSAAMMPGVLSLPHGWGHDQPGTRLQLAAERPGANLNALLDASARDPLSGNAVLSGVAVTLAPA